MKRVPLAALPIVGALALGLSSPMAFAECKDLVLRMQDSSGKTKGREITAFFNCHGGAYDFPEATTLNFFEWKNGQLCHGHRVCGNVKYWKGSFGVGATWVWGSSLTDFTQNTAGFSPVFGMDSGSSNTNESFDTDYDETSINVFFSFDFGNIERYCSGLQDEVCF